MGFTSEIKGEGLCVRLKYKSENVIIQRLKFIDLDHPVRSYCGLQIGESIEALEKSPRDERRSFAMWPLSLLVSSVNCILKYLLRDRKRYLVSCQTIVGACVIHPISWIFMNSPNIHILSFVFKEMNRNTTIWEFQNRTTELNVVQIDW